MTMYFSKSQYGFFDDRLVEKYKKSPAGWPNDAIPLTDDEYINVINIPDGMELSIGYDGKPKIVKKKTDVE